MTVTELIGKLQQFPADCRVVLDGYEDGYNEATDVLSRTLAKQESADWYNGEDADAQDGDAAVFITSARRWNTQ